jgi:OFA family oxalate/formate antiporter-like MFS transporter
MFSDKKLSSRNVFLAVGVFAMLFSGILYAWSILKVPFKSEFGFSDSSLAFNFTLTMCSFCIGAFFGSQLFKRIGTRLTIILSGLLVGIGFICTGLITGSIVYLYIFYAVFAGLGIGIAYNVVISTVNAWFPDKKGLCSGCLMMGFGASALVLGNVADALFKSTLGWRTTYILLGCAICVILFLAGLLLRKPDAQTVLPQPKVTKRAGTETFERQDFSSRQMLCRPSFWMAFLCISFLAAVGSSVISFAKDLALSVHAPETLAVSLVGVLSVCNGFGRILTGAVFDILGRRKTMLGANLLTILAASVTLLAVSIGSLPLCITGLCLTGMSYGSCPTITAAFTSSFFGMKYFSTNMAFMTFTVMGGSLIATVSNKVLEVTGGYPATFIMLLALTFVALILNIFIRKP